MFAGCSSLINLDVSNFHTRNSESFYSMFCDCKSLKHIDVSNFDSFKCENINSMFHNCYNIINIDMMNFDLSKLKYDNENNLNPIDCLFFDCRKLKEIKMNGNIKKEELEKGTCGNMFFNLPKIGKLIINKDKEWNIPLEGLPKLWEKIRK